MSARLWQMGKDLQSRLKGFFESPLEPGATPLELFQAALDELEAKVQPAGRGGRVFPYTRVIVRIAQVGADRSAVEAVFQKLETRLRERLAELQCAAPDAIDVRISFVTEAAADRLHPKILTVDCLVDAETPVQGPAAVRRRRVRVAIVKGACDQAEYTFEGPVIYIGRTAEPVDAVGRVRRNHVAFLEHRDGICETVARAHARLELDVATGEYHLFNEANSNPTFVIRGGRTIRVPPLDPRGLRVESGDEVQLGRAVVRLCT